MQDKNATAKGGNLLRKDDENELSKLREQIDLTDDAILALFRQRMALAGGVADYKRSHGLPVFQSGREREILDRIDEKAGPEDAQSAKLLFQNLMDLSKCRQVERLGVDSPLTDWLAPRLDHPEPIPDRPVVLCQGVEGAYSSLAARRLFPGVEPRFCARFEDVCTAVEDGTADFGLLPIENSSAGSVPQVYELMRKYDFYINYAYNLKISHCLAARTELPLEAVRAVYSHEQGLWQCSAFLRNHPSMAQNAYPNTAAAAKFVAASNEPYAAICSRESAALYGLHILAEDIQNIDENYTRFICISKQLRHSAQADTVTISLAVPNETGALYRLLLKFAVAGLNMVKIQSKPLGNKHFDAIFYIDFIGNCRQSEVSILLADLSTSLPYFKFFGNYPELHGQE